MDETWLYSARRVIHDALALVFPQRLALAQVRARWGRRGSKDALLEAAWFARVRGQGPHVDDRTWDDLELPQVFAELDTTVTPLGSQVLYRRLRTLEDDADALAARHAVHLRLVDDPALRERLQRDLLRIQDPLHAHVADTLHAASLEPSTRRGWISLWSACLLGWLVTVVACGLPLWWWAALIPVNLLILYRYSGRQQREVAGLNGCVRLMRTADALARRPQLPMQHQLLAERPARDGVRRKLLLADMFNWVPPQVTLVLNVCFLLELIVFLWTFERFARVRHRLHASFALVGGLDADIALASALVLHPQHCAPTLADTPTLEIVDGRHPLLRDAVTNSVALARSSALVTGSNMAGKTTFVKMLAINAILGRTAGFCLATRAVLPRVPVVASIQGHHAVASGKSHYFAQIEAIRGFLDQAARNEGALIVLDEPFSGTNTVERVAIAKAVLQALGERALVLVTTHDVELQALLGARYALYHFQEDPDVDGYFDYRLRQGPAQARNAIRMLARLGFPQDVVAEAMSVVRDTETAHAMAPGPTPA